MKYFTKMLPYLLKVGQGKWGHRSKWVELEKLMGGEQEGGAEGLWHGPRVELADMRLFINIF